MSSSVRFIFSTLIKMPIFILVAYVIFNVIAFGTSYFRMLGLSYAVMQTAVENNYIPPAERETLEKYMESLETGILKNIRFTDDTNFTRQQYGGSVIVGISAHYKFIWPLMPREQYVGGAPFEGLNSNRSTAVELSDAQLNQAREAYDAPDNNIVFRYVVPGLKYYSDMNN